MGVLQSKKTKQKEKHLFNMDIKNGTAKEAATKEATDFNHGEANALSGNLSNTANTGQGPAQLTRHQPSAGNEATLTGRHQVPAADVSSVRATEHTSPANPKDKKTSTPKPTLRQAAPARPTAGVKITTGQFDALRSDILQQLQDVSEKLSQQESRPAAQVPQREKSRPPVQRQENRQVMYGHTKHEECRNVTPSQQRSAAKETTEVPLQTVRAAPCDMGTKIRKPGQKSNNVLPNVNEESTNLAHNSAEQSTTTKPGIAEEPAAKPTEPPDHPAQVSNQSNAHVNKEEGALHEQCLNHNITEMIVVDYYCFGAKPEIRRTIATKMRLRQKLRKTYKMKLKAQLGDGRKSSQQTAVQESSQQQGCASMEESTVKKHTEPHQILQPNKADNDTVEVMPTGAPSDAAPHNPKTAAIDTSVKLGLHREMKASLLQDTAVKPKNKCILKALNQNQPNMNTRNGTMKEEVEKNNVPDITPAAPPHNKGRAEGRWHPFTVNQSCPRAVCRQRNPGTGVPQNVQKRPDECPNHRCEPPWVTTARYAACLALRNTLEGGDHRGDCRCRPTHFKFL